MTTFAVQRREHVCDGTPCWCQPDEVDGVVVHQDDLSYAFGLHATFLETLIAMKAEEGA